jgi:hypothetical protein
MALRDIIPGLSMVKREQRWESAASLNSIVCNNIADVAAQPYNRIALYYSGSAL